MKFRLKNGTIEYHVARTLAADTAENGHSSLPQLLVYGVRSTDYGTTGYSAWAFCATRRHRLWRHAVLPTMNSPLSWSLRDINIKLPTIHLFSLRWRLPFSCTIILRWMRIWMRVSREGRVNVDEWSLVTISGTQTDYSSYLRRSERVINEIWKLKCSNY